MRIYRLDLTAPTEIEFTGKFGETPATYLFTPAPDIAPGAYAAEIADPIVINRLLSIEVFAAEGGPGPAAGGGVEAPSDMVSTIVEARIRSAFTAIIGEAPDPAWSEREMFAAAFEHGRRSAAKQTVEPTDVEGNAITTPVEGDSETETEEEDEDTDEGDDAEADPPMTPIGAARERYREVFGRNPSPRWGLEDLQARIADGEAAERGAGIADHADAVEAEAEG